LLLQHCKEQANRTQVLSRNPGNYTRNPKIHDSFNRWQGKLGRLHQGRPFGTMHPASFVMNR
jgi:hypothetical protein